MDKQEEELKKRFHFIYDWEEKRFANLFLSEEEKELLRKQEQEEQSQENQKTE